MFKRVLFGLFLFSAIAATAEHVVIVGTPIDLNAPPGAYISGGPNVAGQWLAQSFKITDKAHVKVVDVVLLPLPTLSPPPFSVLIQLTNRIGPAATPENVLASAVFTPPANTNQLLTIKTNLLLVPGTYYLVASTDSAIPFVENQFQWPFGGTTGIIGKVPIGFFFTGSTTANVKCPPASHWELVSPAIFGTLMFLLRGVHVRGAL